MATRIPGTELLIPDRGIRPIALSDESGQEVPIDIQQHAIDFVFDFYLNDTAVPPATGIWTILCPRGDGVITGIAFRVNTNGSESNDNDVLNILKNGADQITDFIIRDTTTEDTWLAATITGGQIAFSADDLISVDWTNANTSDATGLKVRIRGYYKRDQ